MRNKILFFIAYFTFLIYPFAFAEVPVASTTIFGVTVLGTTIPILVGVDGKVHISATLPYTDGSNDAQALVDASGSVNVNIKADTRFTAIKTTTNTTASTTAQVIAPIANQRRISILIDDAGKEIWVKVGGVDAGLYSGSRIYNSMEVDDCDINTVISYWASETVNISIIQE